MPLPSLATVNGVYYVVMDDIQTVEKKLLQAIEVSKEPREVLRSPDLKGLYKLIGQADSSERAKIGQRVNEVKLAIEKAVSLREEALEVEDESEIDVTSPMDFNSSRPALLTADKSSSHPLMREVQTVSDIFMRMGYQVEESREIDDQYNMFEALNFPKDHPARDDYDTFMTEERDENGDQFIAPAHTSTMQNRVLRKYRSNLDQGRPIAAVVPDRTFRNEDLDARHEHTFYQVEGVYVAKGVHAGMLIATLQEFLQVYYGTELEVRVNPFYFPFTEPSFEFSLSCPFCGGSDPSCKVCSGEGWIELLGCGMIHPRVLEEAGIDPSIYTGFAFGCGIDRLVMMREGIEDIRHFQSAKLDFLRQF